MNAPRTQAYFRCTRCRQQTTLRVTLREYDPAEHVCDHCGESVWVNLDDLRDANGERLISHRPFEEPKARDEQEE